MKIRSVANVTAALSIGMVPFSVDAATDAEIDQLVVTTHYLKQRFEEQERTIKALQSRINELEQHALTAYGMSAARGRGTEMNSASLPQANEQLAQRSVAREMPPSQQSAVQSGTSNQTGTTQAQAITSTQGIPLFEKKFSLEQSLTYTHYDRRSLVLNGFLALDAILLGTINLQQIKTDQVQYDLTGRWNVSDRLSLDLNLPVLYRTSNYFSPGAGGSASAISDASSSTGDVGDINAGLYYQLGKSSPLDLDWIASVRIKAPTGRHPFGIKFAEADPNNSNLLIPTRQPTGNGIWSTSLGLSVVKTYDPVVIFGNIGYNYNFKRSFSDLSSTQDNTTPGEVKLGNSWSLGAGFALALNDRTSISFSYAQTVQGKASLRAENGPWVKQVGSDSNSATFNVGLTNQLTRNLSVVGTASMGLTPDAPDFSIGIKFPYSF